MSNDSEEEKSDMEELESVNSILRKNCIDLFNKDSVRNVLGCSTSQVMLAGLT